MVNQIQNANSSRKWSWIMLVMILTIIVVLSGCSSNNMDNNGATNEPTTPAINNSDNGEKEPEPAKRGSITASVYDRGSVPAEEGTIEDNRWTKWLNENGPTDVKFTAVPRFESQQKFNVMFASQSAPDIIFEFDTSYRNQLFNQKQLMPIDDMINNYSTTYKALLETNPQLKKLATKSDGKMYEFGRINGLIPNHVLFIRNDWLQKLNLEIPKTTDELYEVAKAFATQDPDGNGKDDTYGMALSFVSGMIVDYTFGSVFTIYEKYPWYVENDTLVHDWDRTEAAIAFKKKLYDDGIVDKDFLSDSKGEKAKQDWINGKLGMYGANGGTGDYATFEAVKNNNPDADIIPIELPVSPFGQFSPVINNPVQMTAVVNAGTKDPEAVMKYIDFLVEPSTMETLRSGIEGEHYTMVDGCVQPIDLEKNKQEVAYSGDFRMLNSANLDTFMKCTSIQMINNPTPVQEEFYKAKEMAFDAYLNSARPMPALAHSEHMPVLPADMQLTVTNAFKAILDLLQRSIITGSSYSAEQAIADAKDAWQKAGGDEVDTWHADWYAANKDIAFLTSDMYEFIPR